MHPTTPAIMTETTPAIMTETTPAIMTATTPVKMPMKQVEAMKRGEIDSGELAIAVLETGSRGGSDHRKQPLLAAHDQRQTIERRGSRGLKVKRNVETVVGAADGGSGIVWATGDGQRAIGHTRTYNTYSTFYGCTNMVQKY